MGIILGMLRSLRLRCPHCHKGRVMKNWFIVDRACTACGYVFLKEQGDFWGGMVFSYTYAGMLALITAGALIELGWLTGEQRAYVAAAVAFSSIFLLHPVTRSNWITLLYLTRGGYAEYAPPDSKPRP